MCRIPQLFGLTIFYHGQIPSLLTTWPPSSRTCGAAAAGAAARGWKAFKPKSLVGSKQPIKHVPNNMSRVFIKVKKRWLENLQNHFERNDIQNCSRSKPMQLFLSSPCQGTLNCPGPGPASTPAWWLKILQPIYAFVEILTVRFLGLCFWPKKISSFAIWVDYDQW